MFFQTSAETVGMTKKGAMTRMRTTPCPHIGWSRRIARRMPKTIEISSAPPTIISVVTMDGQKALDETKRTKFSSPTKPWSPPRRGR